MLPQWTNLRRYFWPLMQSDAIRLINLSCGYGGTPLLQGVNLTIPTGSYVGIFGPNGGGKTTLLQAMLGLLPPLQGEVQLLGRPPEQSRHLVGYVPQAARIDRAFPITAEEVVLSGFAGRLGLFGRGLKEAKKAGHQALERVGMEHLAHHPFGKLSGGEAQRVLIARAIVDHPLLLLLDEPTSSIDPAAERSILTLLSELRQEMTIVMVTHSLHTVLHEVETLLCVHREVCLLSPQGVCEHFGLGLYHAPSRAAWERTSKEESLV